MRRQRLIATAVLLAAVLGAAALLWWPRAPAPVPGTPLSPLTSLARNDITALRVRHESDMVRLRQQAGVWRLVAPVDGPADPPHITLLLDLARAVPIRRVGNRADPDASTGLGRQAVVVIYNHGPPIRIGGPGPSRGTRFVQTPEGTYLLAVPHFNTLAWHWTDWLDRALVPPHRTLSRIVLPEHTLSRAGADARWQVSPHDAPSDQAAQLTAAAWQQAKALMIVPADESRARRARVTLYFTQGPPRHLDVIQSDPNLILRNPRLGVDYRLAGNRVGPLLALKHPALSAH